MRADTAAGGTAPLPARVPELDGLRGLAILLVLIWHYVVVSTRTGPGTAAAYALACGKLAWSGVDLFFVLSGFLIGGILYDARDQFGYFKTFYIRRAYRILPVWLLTCAAYWIAVVALHVVRVPLDHWLFAGAAPWFTYATFTQNLWMAESGHFGPNWLGVSWSLAVEEQFYLTLPLLIRFVDPRALPRLLLSLAIAAPLLRTVLCLISGPDALAIYVLPATRMDALLLGAVVAIAVRDPASWKRIKAGGRWLNHAFLALAGGCAIATVAGWSLGSVVMSTVGYSWLAVFYACALLIAISQPETVLARLLRTRPLMWLGTIAYGVYLFHQPVIGIVRLLLRPERGLAVGESGVHVCALALTLSLAHISWTFLEKPLIRRGHAHKYGIMARAEDVRAGVGIELGVDKASACSG